MTDQILTDSIKNQLMILESKELLEPVQAIHPNGIKQHMERIIGTTKYLSNMRKIIYDVSFLVLYNHDNKIPEGCFAIDNFLYKIDKWGHIEFPEKFKSILDSEPPQVKGACIYLDNVLYESNIPFNKYEKLRDHLLRQRTDGLMWFEVLKTVDASGNATCFYPSPTAIKNHERNKGTEEGKQSSGTV